MLMRLMAGFLLLSASFVGAVEPTEGGSGSPPTEQNQQSLPQEQVGAMKDVEKLITQFQDLPDDRKEELLKRLNLKFSDDVEAKGQNEVWVPTSAPVEVPDTRPSEVTQFKNCIKTQSWRKCYRQVRDEHTIAYFPNPAASVEKVTDGLWLYKPIEFEELQRALSTTVPTSSE